MNVDTPTPNSAFPNPTGDQPKQIPVAKLAIVVIVAAILTGVIVAYFTGLTSGHSELLDAESTDTPSVSATMTPETQLSEPAVTDTAS